MDPFVAEIRIFPFNFAPKGWAWCNGQILPLSQNTALFSLLGTTYGGDGKSTFALPDLQGRAAAHPDGVGGSSFQSPGIMAGSETVTLLESEMPVHSHGVMAGPTFIGADNNVPAGNAFAKSTQGNAYGAAGNAAPLATQAIAPA